MKSCRRKTHTRLTKVVAIGLSMLFLQMLGAAVIHVTLQQHAYCESHQAIEHVDADELAHGEAHAEVSDDGSHPPADDSGSDESCDLLTWLQGPTVPLPQIHASLLNLPPPPQPAAVRPVTRQALIPSQIDLLRLSPGHSPPVRTGISV